MVLQRDRECLGNRRHEEMFYTLRV
jgi:hypothetical protein